MIKADGIIILDDVQRSTREYENRCLVADQSRKHHWLTIPVSSSSRAKINEAQITNKEPWLLYHARKLSGYYSLNEPGAFNILSEFVNIHESYFNTIHNSLMNVLRYHVSEMPNLSYSSELKEAYPHLFQSNPVGSELIIRLMIAYKLENHSEIHKLNYFTGTDVKNYIKQDEIDMWMNMYDIGLKIDDWRPNHCNTEEAKLSWIHHFILHHKSLMEQLQ